MRRWLLIGVVTILTIPGEASQRFGFGRSVPGQIPYDGRFVLARLWYPFYPGWSFDWPDMEDNLGKILRALTLMRPHPDGGNIFRMDDPELLKFPIAYLSEPGYWHPSDSEVLGLRRYLAKGGFLIVDDFHFENEWQVFEDAIRRVLPKGKIERLHLSHPIFHTFFEITTLEIPYPGQLGQRGLMGEFYGIHEDDNPSHRLMVVINYNMDIGDYMEHSARGFYPVDPTNEAFKFGVNYLIYGLTH
jgi:uncharacterized protein DUF4159